jgi:hypothetical protein
VDPNARERLIGILRKEIDSPGTQAAVFAAMKEASPGDAPLLEFLAAWDEHHRNAFYAKSQHVWTRRFGWRIMRPLFILAVLAAAGFCLQRAVDPVLGVTIFLGGAAALYVLIQVFAHVWAERDLRKVEGIDARYRDRLRALLEDLGGNES